MPSLRPGHAPNKRSVHLHPRLQSWALLFTKRYSPMLVVTILIH